MLEVPTLRSPSKAADHHVGFTDCGEDEFMVVDDNLLDYIDFTSCDVSSLFDADGDILPDLEVDPTELLAEFEDHHDSGAAETKPPDDVALHGHNKEEEKDEKRLFEHQEEEEQNEGQKKKGRDNEVLSAVATEDDSAAAAGSSAAEGQSKKTKPPNNSHGNKRKVKVDWTPELHRRFVQAVEQLGIDKAVPSRILEIMGIECLTRHNIASHLQKYRSHRKHLVMAREAAAASWAASGTGAPRTKQDMPAAGPPWVVPTIGFPPPPFRGPLHVWGHPPTTVGAAPMLPVWPRHLTPPWAPPVDPAYWHQQYNAARKWGPHAVPPPMPPTSAMLPRFPAPPPVPGMMPHPMYRPIPSPPPPPQTGMQLQLDAHPSKESIDAAIGDVLVKPWLPLPLGLKPPSLDGVMSELHKQGIPNIPPAAS